MRVFLETFIFAERGEASAEGGGQGGGGESDGDEDEIPLSRIEISLSLSLASSFASSLARALSRASLYLSQVYYRKRVYGSLSIVLPDRSSIGAIGQRSRSR